MFESNGWVRRVVGCSALATAAIVNGCATKDVSVGAEGYALNMNQCYKTDCSKSVKTKVLDQLEPVTCATVGANYRAATTYEYATSICPAVDGAAICRIYQVSAKAAPDLSIWLFLTVRNNFEEGGAYWLQHYAADGALLGSEQLLAGPSVASWGTYANFLVDDVGHAWVAIYTIDAGPNADTEVREAVWVMNYDASLQRLTDPIALQGTALPQLATAPGHGIAIAGSAFKSKGGAVMSQLSREGELLWTQNGFPGNISREGVGVSGVVMDGAGSTTILSERDWTIGANSSFGLSQFDETGRLVWDGKLSQAFAQGEWTTLAGDDAGRLIVGGYIPTADQAERQRFIRYLGFGPGGDARWAWNIDAWSVATPTVEQSSGAVYVSAPGFGTAEGQRLSSRFLEISPEGDSCVIHQVNQLSGGTLLADLMAPAPGILYYITGELFGQLELEPNP